MAWQMYYLYPEGRQMNEMTMSEMAAQGEGIKRFAGYRFLLGPEQLCLSPGRRVSSPEEYLGWHVSIVTQRGGDPWDSPEPTKARINHGRWIADCFWCKTGMLTRPEWGIAYCGECGARYHKEQVEFPEDYSLIEALLLRRVQRAQQNWDSRQTLNELAEENLSPEVITP